MPTDFSNLAGILYCPDDGHQLNCEPLRIHCPSCRREFPICEDRIAEVLPRSPVASSTDDRSLYWLAYQRIFREPLCTIEGATAWGAAEAVPPSWVKKRLRQTKALESLLGGPASRGREVLCDIAAGAGYYTLAYAARFQTVLHCDLSSANLVYAARKAKSLGLENIFFLRTDYFAMPFRHSVGHILCLDTLIRGEKHELAVLKSICAALAPGGRAIVDFHNWWHNPARRLGLLPQNFHGNRSYRASETSRLLKEAGITHFDSFRFHQEFEPDHRYRRLLGRLIPATRLLFRFGSNQSCEC